MTSSEDHRQQPTEEEKFAAAGAGNYVGVPISDEEMADVWTSTPDESENDAAGNTSAEGDNAGT